ncbi:MAG: hypothetical protein GX623_09790 [Clostridiales bacterium]|nr:hypothetical protein [Clostridiales bacterium]
MTKRLEAVEESFGQGMYVVVYRGLPPYYVQASDPGSRGNYTEPLLIETPAELEAYLDSLPRSAKVVEIVCEEEGEPTVPSSEIYSWGQ